MNKALPEKLTQLVTKFPHSMQAFHCMYQQDRQCTYTCKVEARSRDHRCRGKAIRITYYECVSVVLVIQHATRMRRIILSSVACLALPNFSMYLTKGTIFGKKLMNIKCVF